jgi:hypothetical protein
MRLIGRCPQLTGVTSYCWKFLDPDPSALADFRLLFAAIGGSLPALNIMVPLDAGGAQQFVQHGGDYLNSQLVQTLRQAYGDGGSFTASSSTLDPYYQQLQTLLRGAQFLVGRLDANGELTEPYTEVTDYDFPPLPR